MPKVAQKTATRTTEPPPSAKRARRPADPAAELNDHDVATAAVKPTEAALVLCEALQDLGVAISALERRDVSNVDDLVSVLLGVRHRLRGVHAVMVTPAAKVPPTTKTPDLHRCWLGVLEKSQKQVAELFRELSDIAAIDEEDDVNLFLVSAFKLLGGLAHNLDEVAEGVADRLKVTP